MLVFAQHVLQPATVFRSLRLAHVALPWKNDRVCKEDTSLQAVHAPVVFHAVRGKVVARQIRQREVVTPKVSLIGQRMRGERGAKWQPPVGHKDRQERRLPAIGQENLWSWIHPARELHDALGKVDEARRVVLIIAPVHPIESRTIEILVSRDQKDLDSLRGLRLENLARDPSVAHLDVEFDARLLRFRDLALPNAAIIRNNHADLMPQTEQLRVTVGKPRRLVHRSGQKGSTRWRQQGSSCLLSIS